MSLEVQNRYTASSRDVKGNTVKNFLIYLNISAFHHNKAEVNLFNIEIYLYSVLVKGTQYAYSGISRHLNIFSFQKCFNEKNIFVDTFIAYIAPMSVFIYKSLKPKAREYDIVMLDRGYITRRRTMLVDHRAMME
jgi:hypothetical protein